MKLLRKRCEACPWRDMEAMRRDFPEVVAHARARPDGFVCHTRCGPCDGPTIAWRQDEPQSLGA
jgi:hypothetical protein